MARLRLCVFVEYDARDDGYAYGTSDPAEMAKIDEEQLQIYPAAILEMLEVALGENDHSATIEVQVV